MKSQRIRIGVLGAGHLGRIHVQQLLNVPEFEVVGVFDPHAEKREAIRAEFNVPGSASAEELMAKVDAIDIVTPTLAHHPLAKRALDAGLHAFIEKPVTVTVEEAEDLLRTATERGRVVQVGHVERFNPAFQAALPYFGAPMFIEGHRLAQWNPRGTDVSVVLDLMIHDIDLILHVVKSPVRAVQASGVAVVSDSPDICNARIAFANGCVANLTASRISLKNMRKSRFFQRDAYISVDMLEKVTEIVRMRPVEGEADPFAVTIDLGSGKGRREISFEKPTVPVINAIREELAAFAVSIREGRPPKVTLAEAMEALRTALAVLESMDSPNS
ncbi:MAG TPA: Gfo/Idh/MocA family oxidoreductase [Flavobacteriales bacterium]|nr:Gfo/Idh/MocA family oxidoreductase [Flavobacteriales bacterium]